MHLNAYLISFGQGIVNMLPRRKHKHPETDHACEAASSALRHAMIKSKRAAANVRSAVSEALERVRVEGHRNEGIHRKSGD